MNVWRHGLSAVLALVFASAGFLKLADPLTFSRDVENYHLVGAPWTGMLAVYLPWLEILAAAALLVPRWRMGATWLVLAMTAAFAVALASAESRGIDIQCGCFGSGSTTTVGWALVRVAGIAMLVVALVWLERRATHRDGATYRSQR